MRHEKAGDGRVYVWVGTTQDTTQDTAQDAGGSSQDVYQDTTQNDRLEDLREQIAYLRRQLDEERDARRRADTILAQLSQANAEQARTIRAIEAPQEARESPETADEQQGRGEPHSDAPGAQGGVQRRPWWRRVFGG
jgi:chromosome segregation ATPase